MVFILVKAPRVTREFARLSLKDRARVEGVFGRLLEDPFSGKKLMGELEGYYSARVWPYRVIYQVLKKEQAILVRKIEDRKDVYK